MLLTNDAMAELRAVAPPPAPREPYPVGDWIDAQHRLGSRMPSDYGQFIDNYGSAYVGGFLYPFSPFTANPHLNLIAQVAPTLSALRELKGSLGDEEVPYPIWFEPGGLLPWGRTDNGDTLYWLTAGSPDAWTIVVNASRSARYEAYPMGMVEFLARLLSGRIQSYCLPADLKGIAALADEVDLAR